MRAHLVALPDLGSATETSSRILTVSPFFNCTTTSLARVAWPRALTRLPLTTASSSATPEALNRPLVMAVTKLSRCMEFIACRVLIRVGSCQTIAESAKCRISPAPTAAGLVPPPRSSRAEIPARSVIALALPHGKADACSHASPPVKICAPPRHRTARPGFLARCFYLLNVPSSDALPYASGLVLRRLITRSPSFHCPRRFNTATRSNRFRTLRLAARLLVPRRLLCCDIN